MALLGNVRVEMDEAAIYEMACDWSSPVGEAILDATQVVEDTARISAPVSPKGSKLAPIGYLKAHTSQSETLHNDDNGYVLGLVGAARYPFNFIRNPTSNKGFTWNKNRTKRPGNNRYLDDSLNSLGGFIRYVD
jgi:hypothetical protein